jgi:hypothetical protein
MSFMPNAGTVVRLTDGRVCAVTGFTPSGDDDRVVFPDGHEERITACDIEELLTDEDSVGRDTREELAKYLAGVAKS